MALDDQEFRFLVVLIFGGHQERVKEDDQSPSGYQGEGNVFAPFDLALD